MSAPDRLITLAGDAAGRGPRGRAADRLAADEACALTVGAMKDRAREGAAHASVIQLAAALRADAALHGRVGPRVLETVYDWLRRVVAFAEDPAGVELIRAPWILVREIAAAGRTWCDCDENATLGAALTLALGLPAAFVLVGPAADGPFRHVFWAAQTGGGAGGEIVYIDAQEGRPPSRFAPPAGRLRVEPIE